MSKLKELQEKYLFWLGWQRRIKGKQGYDDVEIQKNLAAKELDDYIEKNKKG